MKYLFPGTKHGARKKRRVWWTITAIVGVSVAALVGALLYYIGKF